MSDNKPQYGEFCWNELLTPDVNAAKAFYEKLLGWTFQDHSMDMGEYFMIHRGEKGVGGMMKVPSPDIPPHWMSYISVEDLDATLKKAASLGATIIKEATDVKDYGRFGIIKDPTGAHISFWQPFCGK